MSSGTRKLPSQTNDDTAAGNLPAEQPCRGCGPLGRRIGNADFGGAGRGQFHGHGLGQFAGIEDQAAFASRVGHAAERFDQPAAFGVVAQQAVLFADDEVHAAQQCGRIGRAVQQRKDGPAVGIGDRAAAKTHRPHAAQGVGQTFRRHLQAEESPVEIQVGEGLFDHVLHGVAADRTGQQRQDGLHRGAGHERNDSETSVRIARGFHPI